MFLLLEDEVTNIYIHKFVRTFCSGTTNSNWRWQRSIPSQRLVICQVCFLFIIFITFIILNFKDGEILKHQQTVTMDILSF